MDQIANWENFMTFLERAYNEELDMVCLSPERLYYVASQNWNGNPPPPTHIHELHIIGGIFQSMLAMRNSGLSWSNVATVVAQNRNVLRLFDGRWNPALP